MGARLLEAGIKTAVITQGADGCLVFDAKEGNFHQAAFDVPVVDSTGYTSNAGHSDPACQSLL